ncbi:MAG: hypothetical protein ACMUHY_01810 [Thermoplasmatota archaeon]
MKKARDQKKVLEEDYDHPEDCVYSLVHREEGVRIGYSSSKGSGTDTVLIEVDLYLDEREAEHVGLEKLLSMVRNILDLGFTVSLGGRIDLSCSKELKVGDLQRELAELSKALLGEGGVRS